MRWSIVVSNDSRPVLNNEEHFKFWTMHLNWGIGIVTFNIPPIPYSSSDAYGDSEDLMGKWFKCTGKYDSIFLTMKFGFSDITRRVIRCDPPCIKHAIEKSLKRLGVDYINLYYAHRMDATVPIEETVAAMAELVK
ncbi:NADP-dependent oxidoreductase domain-containing protein [Hysterangium stoloniferum]|nr:NADP-dependent oxidoreductase domain-containing protein [Hysterangium stoloniferum]